MQNRQSQQITQVADSSSHSTNEVQPPQGMSQVKEVHQVQTNYQKVQPLKKESPQKKPCHKQDGDDQEQCAICLKTPEHFASIDSCNHRYCYDCIYDWAQKRNACPQCKQKFYKIETFDEKGQVLQSKKIDDHTCNECHKEYDLYQYRIQCNCHCILNFDDGIIPSICNDCVPTYERKHQLCLFFCKECLSRFQNSLGTEFFKEQINSSSNVLNKLCQEKYDYDMKISKVERKLKKVMKKLKDMASEEETADIYKLKLELNLKLEKNKMKMSTLKTQKRQIISQIDELVVKYKQFIEMEAGTIV